MTFLLKEWAITVDSTGKLKDSDYFKLSKAHIELVEKLAE